MKRGFSHFLTIIVVLLVAVGFFLISRNLNIKGVKSQSVNYPWQDPNCGWYAPAGNFGDPYCTYSNNGLWNKLYISDYKRAWYYMYHLAPCESYPPYNPDSYLKNSTSGYGAYGLFQMNPNGAAGPYDYGNVWWGLQATHAVAFNKSRDNAFSYWACSNHDPDAPRGSAAESDFEKGNLPAPVTAVPLDIAPNQIDPPAIFSQDLPKNIQKIRKKIIDRQIYSHFGDILLAQNNSYKILYISGNGKETGPDIFLVFINRNPAEKAKQQAQNWFLKFGLKQKDLCDLPVRFVLANYDLRKTNKNFSSLPSGCKSVPRSGRYGL